MPKTDGPWTQISEGKWRYEDSAYSAVRVDCYGYWQVQMNGENVNPPVIGQTRRSAGDKIADLIEGETA